MKLRTRLTLIVTLAFIGMAGGIMAESVFRESIDRQRLADVVTTGDRNAWHGVIVGEVRLLELVASDLAQEEQVVRGVGGHDRDELASYLRTRRQELGVSSKSGRLPEIAVRQVDGTALVDGSGDDPERTALLSPRLVREAARDGRARSGLLRRPDGQPMLAAIAPVFTREGLHAFVATAVEVAPLLDEFARTIDAEALLLPIPEQGIGVTIGIPALEPPTDVAPQETSTMLADDWEIARDVGGGAFSQARIVVLDLFGRPLALLVTSRDVTAEQRRLELMRMFSYAGVGAALILLVGFLQWYMRNAFRPLNAVIGVLNGLSLGRRVQLPGSELRAGARSDEIGRLADAVVAFERNLGALEEARAAQNRIEGELAVAAGIQRNILPAADDPLPERADLDLHAVMEPAKAVGGDLYDFFMLDDHRLYFLVGDVSDKGVPSALFMAIVRTVFKVMAQATDLAPGELVTAANRYLSANNPSNMFVTIFVGVLDTRSGRIAYCDGGHEPPFILRADGSVELLVKEGGLALGCIEDFVYRQGEIRLAPGETILLYTDGVTEATDDRKAMFTLDRVQVVLERGQAGASGPRSATRTLIEAVHSFADGAEQSDDITVLALRYLGPADSATMHVAA